MDGMADAGGPLQGDVVEKHGSGSGWFWAANGVLSPTQSCKQTKEHSPI